MTLYIRKVMASKWKPKQPVNETDSLMVMETDGITNCCKTKDNTLSIWKVDSVHLESVNDRKVISTLSTNGGSLSPFDCIFIDGDDLTTLGLTVEKSEGESLLEDIKNELHYDICNLNIQDLITFGRYVNSKVRGVNKNSGVIVGPQAKKIPLNLIKSCIAEYMPEDSVIGKELLLKKGFSNTYS